MRTTVDNAFGKPGIGLSLEILQSPCRPHRARGVETRGASVGAGKKVRSFKNSLKTFKKRAYCHMDAVKRALLAGALWIQIVEAGSVAHGAEGRVRLSEFVATGSAVEDEDFEEPDWIEIENFGKDDVALEGWFLTDDAANPTKWRFPASALESGAHMIVFASGKDRPHVGTPPHTNFKLDKDGGYLALVKPDGRTRVSEYRYEAQTKGVSFGNHNGEVGYLETPTPGSANVGLVAGKPPAASVRLSTRGGVIGDPVELAIAVDGGDSGTIRYSLDGGVPTPASPRYEKPLVINESAVVRARTFKDGHLPGPVSSASFHRLEEDLRSFSSDLPIVVVDTLGYDVNAEFDPRKARPFRPSYALFFEAEEGKRASFADRPCFHGRTGIHVRGGSSARFPKKQYALEVRDERDEDKDAQILGFPAESDFVLHAPYSDKTLMRNVLVYRLMRELAGEGAAMRTRYVELFFNQDGGTLSMDDYAGVYVFMERIKRGKSRLPVEKLNPFVTAPDRISGGYIFKKDDEPISFRTAVEGHGFTIARPRISNGVQRDYLSSYLGEFEKCLRDPGFPGAERTYTRYIDVDSFVMNHLAVEIFRNIEGFRRSAYFTKFRDGPVRALPVWDYNLALGNASSTRGYQSEGWHHETIPGTGASREGRYPWYDGLFGDPGFRLRYWDIYHAWRGGLLAEHAVGARIDDLARHLSEAQERNFKRWPVLGKYVWPNPRGFEQRNTFESEVTWMRSWLLERLAWIDAQSPGMPAITSEAKPGGKEVRIELRLPEGVDGEVFYTLDGSDPREASTARTATIALVDSGTEVFALVPDAGNGGMAMAREEWMDRVPGNAAEWLRGRLPAGFETLRSDQSPLKDEIRLDLGGQMHEKATACFLRIPFAMDPVRLATIDGLRLGMRHTGGFVAYLNGREVARANVPQVVSANKSASQPLGREHAANPVVFDITSQRNLLRNGQNTLSLFVLTSSASDGQGFWQPTLLAFSRERANESSAARRYTKPLTVPRGATLRARGVIAGQWTPHLLWKANPE